MSNNKIGTTFGATLKEGNFTVPEFERERGRFITAMSSSEPLSISDIKIGMTIFTWNRHHDTVTQVGEVISLVKTEKNTIDLMDTFFIKCSNGDTKKVFASFAGLSGSSSILRPASQTYELPPNL